MKRILLIIALILCLASPLWAGPSIEGGAGGGTSDLTAPGPIGGTTPGAGTFTTLTTTGDATIGATTAGKNLSIVATRGTELVTWTDAGWNEDASTWTFAGGVLTHVTGNTTAVTATLTAAIVAGTTYEVTITGTGGGATATYTFGGVTGTTIAASGAIAITDNITATTTGSFIITPASTNTVAISSISIKALTNATGDLTVGGDLTLRGQIFLNGGVGTASLPQYSFVGDVNTGVGRVATDKISLIAGGEHYIAVSTSGVELIKSTTPLILYDTYLYRDAAAETLALRHATAQQIMRIYNTADAHPTLTNYERLTLTGVQGASVNITAETAGTGGDNLDVVLTPAGTGAVKTAAGYVQSVVTNSTTAGQVLTATAVAGVAAYSSTLTAQLGDDAAQIKGSTAGHVGLFKVDLAGSTTDKTMTFVSSQTDNRSLTLPNTTGTLAVVQKGYTVASAGMMIADTSASIATVDSNPNQMQYLAFDGGTDEYAVFQWQPPDDWDLGTIKFKAVWAAGGDMDAAQTVIWGLDCYAISDGDDPDVAFDAGEVFATGDAYADGDETKPLVKVSAASAAVTVQGTPALGDLVMCRVSRNADTDTSTADAWLLGIRIEYGKLSAPATAW